MKKYFFQKSLLTYSLYFLLTVTLIGIGGCSGKIKKVVDQVTTPITNIANNTNAILDKAMSDINGNAENFANIMQEAIDKVDDADVKAQLEDALGNATAAAGTEVRCSIDFVGQSLNKRLRVIKAAFNKKPLPPLEPGLCQVIPANIDMNVNANNRNRVNITGYFMNEDFSKYKLYHFTKSGAKSDKTVHLSLSTDYKLVINLGSNGIVLNQNSAKLRLMWGSKLISDIPVIQPHRQPCGIKERSLTGLSDFLVHPRLKPNPANGKTGDKEFDGNGPCSKAKVTIYTKNNGTELWAKIGLAMYECPDDLDKYKHDYTYGRIDEDRKLTTTDSGWRIKRIKIATVDYLRNIDNGHATELVDGGGPVLSYKILGDTGGDDLDESYVSVKFRPIKVTLEEIGDCISNPSIQR